MLKWPDKDPSARKDYAVDWSALLQTGETIVASTWTITPAGDLTSETPSIVGGVAFTWLTGGTVGTTYDVVNRITTSRGLIDERTTRIKIKEQ